MSIEFIRKDELLSYIIRDDCDDRCGYIDERDIPLLTVYKATRNDGDYIVIGQEVSNGKNKQA